MLTPNVVMTGLMGQIVLVSLRTVDRPIDLDSDHFTSLDGRDGPAFYLSKR